MTASAILRPVIALLVAMVLASAAAANPARAPDLELTGVLTGADNQTYVTVPFQVPADVGRITVAFDYTGRETRTTVDLGLFDPAGFRGWSGGNKARFTLSETDATPSYLPGSIPAGTWRLLLGVPNIGGTTRSTYTARIWFDRRGTAPEATPPLRPEARWYRGDFHVHSGHSDGTCKSRLGVSTPCPVFRILMEAADRKLDFIALTDHNTISQFADVAALQPWFDDLLILPGREITTFQGHANLFGVDGFVDFRLGSTAVPDFGALLDRLPPGGLVSLNHPGLPSGAFCMGCGWTAAFDASRVAAVEVLNGGAITASGGKAETGFSGIRFWEGLLNRGYRVTAIGGSDSHDADRAAGLSGAIGRPTTVVFAETLSTPAILEGVRRGRAYVDVEASGATLTFSAVSQGRTYAMGDQICARRGQLIRLGVTAAPADAVAEIVTSPNLTGQVSMKAPSLFELKSDGQPGWVRANLRAADGRLLVLGNPVYLGCPAQPHRKAP